MLTIHADSHTDHIAHIPGLLEFILGKFAYKNGFFIESFDLPEQFPDMVNNLYGPVVGDQAITEAEVFYGNRDGRKWPSRMVNRPARPTRILTVIAGQFLNHECVLYTAFGGPCAAKEVNDPTLTDRDREASERFWAEHALAGS